MKFSTMVLVPAVCLGITACSVETEEQLATVSPVSTVSNAAAPAPAAATAETETFMIGISGMT